MSAATIILAAVIIIFIIVRQVTAQQVSNRSLLMPAVLAILAVSRLHLSSDPLTLIIAAGCIGLGLICGVATALNSHLWIDPATGAVYRQGSWIFLLVYLGLILLRIGIDVVLKNSGLLPTSTEISVDLLMGLATLGSRVGVIYLRALMLCGGDVSRLSSASPHVPVGRV